MKSQLTDDFVDCFSKLPEAVRTQARKNYRLWKADSSHPGLHFKRVSVKESIYSVRIGIG